MGPIKIPGRPSEAPLLSLLRATPQDMPLARDVLLFLADEAKIPGGVTRDQLMDMQTSDFLAHPELLDWLLPADGWFHPLSTAPRLDLAQAQWLLGCDEVGQRLYAHYSKFLTLHGMVVDHHGWVFSSCLYGGEDTRPLCAQLVSEPARGARALRFLKLTGFVGYSTSGDTVGDLSYAEGLRNRLSALWRASPHGRQLQPHAWGAALDL